MRRRLFRLSGLCATRLGPVSGSGGANADELGSHTSLSNGGSTRPLPLAISVSCSLYAGDVPVALAQAEESVALADRSGDEGQRIFNRTTLADTLHQSGRTSEAATRFQEAELAGERVNRSIRCCIRYRVSDTAIYC